MGCDIHMHVEVRLAEGHSRDDRSVRALQRRLQADPADAALAERLERYTRYSSWLTACAEILEPMGEGEEEDARSAQFIFLLHAWEERTGGRLALGRYGSPLVTLVPDIPLWNVRSSAVFAALSGGVVRNHYGLTGLAPLRGLPEDVSAIVALAHESWRDGAFAASWLSAGEVLGWRGWEQQVGSCVLREWGQGLLNMVQSHAERFGAAHTRIVFWFDS